MMNFKLNDYLPFAVNEDEIRENCYIKSRAFNGEDYDVIEFLADGKINSGDLVFSLSEVDYREDEDEIWTNGEVYFPDIESALAELNYQKEDWPCVRIIWAYQANVVAGYLFLEPKGIIRISTDGVEQDLIDGTVKKIHEMADSEKYGDYWKEVDYMDLLLEVKKEKTDEQIEKELLTDHLKDTMTHFDDKDWESILKMWDMWVDTNIDGIHDMTPIKKEQLKANSFVDVLRIFANACSYEKASKKGDE